MDIFVSHSSEDSEFCDTFVSALRKTGADVWYDVENLGAGVLRTEIMRELSERHTFIVVLSPTALHSRWVQDECEWAYNLLQREPHRIFVPVTARTYDPHDFKMLLYVEGMKRVEAAGYRPYDLSEIIEHTCRLLSLTSKAEVTVTAPLPEEGIDDLIAHGKALNAQRQSSRALQYFEKVCHLAPDNADVWVNLGYTFNTLRRFDEALTASEHALLLAPHSPAAWTRKGAALLNLKRFTEALTACDEALRLDQSYPDAWSIKGMVLYAQGHFDEAVTSGQSAVALDPHYAEGWSRLADGLLQAHRFDEAIIAYDLALALGGDAVANWNGKATALLELGRPDEALELLRKTQPQVAVGALAAFAARHYLNKHRK